MNVCVYVCVCVCVCVCSLVVCRHFGPDSFGEDETPCLCIAYENGRMQLMRSQYDDSTYALSSARLYVWFAWWSLGCSISVE